MPYLIEAQNISYTYHDSTRVVLANCSLSVNQGELISILGPNGAGKSTLLNCLAGLLKPQKGKILLNGTDILQMSRRKIARVIGYVQQTQQMTFAYTVFNYVLMGKASNIGIFQTPNEEDRQDVYQTLFEMGISHLSDSAVTEISGGERQQVAIARTIVQQPQVIIFDEPTAHLDYGNQISTLKLISALHEKGFAIVMTTHNPDHCMMLGGKVAILDKEGKLETGVCEELLTEDRLKQLYNTELRLPYVEAVNRITCIPLGISLKKDIESIH